MPYKAKKYLGQNFLISKRIIHKIIEQVNIRKGDDFIEIGPGFGALTKYLLQDAGSLTVIEYDHELIPILKQNIQNFGNPNIINQDVLTVQLDQLCKTCSTRIIGNLPYNISSAILFHLIKFSSMFKDIHFMLQQEVVDRIIASPTNKTYGRLSVMLQYHFHTEGLFNVLPDAFEPIPRVYSRIIRLTPSISSLKANNYNIFSQVVKQTFGQRRKTLKNALRSLVTHVDLFLSSPIDLTLRPENLSVKDFILLSNFLEDKICQPT